MISSASGALCWCAVCHCPSGALFFGIPSCRPCASFFRRSIRDQRQYHCRGNNECPVDQDGMRNCCRACRFRRCLEAGMNTELAHSEPPKMTPSTRTKSSPSTTDTDSASIVGQDHYQILPYYPPTPSPLSSSLHVVQDSKVPYIQHIANAVREFSDGERAICALHLGLNTVLGKEIRMITHEEHLRVERDCIRLLLTLVRAIYPLIDAIPIQQKVDILKQFTFHFYALHRCDLTVQFLPENPEPNFFMIRPGCLFNVELFCQTMTGLGIQQQMVMSRQFLARMHHFLKSTYKPLAITPLELAALQGIQLWQCVGHSIDQSNFDPPAAEHPRDILFAELHHLIASEKQHLWGSYVMPVVIRNGRMLAMLNEMTWLSQGLAEMFTLCKMFLGPETCANFTDLWEEMFAAELARK